MRGSGSGAEKQAGGIAKPLEEMRTTATEYGAGPLCTDVLLPVARTTSFLTVNVEFARARAVRRAACGDFIEVNFEQGTREGTRKEHACTSVSDDLPRRPGMSENGMVRR
jgi:hypothetical protein